MVPISPQVYSAEAVTFDTKSLFDYMQRLDERRAKRALAEQEAFDEWNKANEKAFDSSNLRTQERPLFDKKLQEYRQLSLEAKRNPRDYNKKALAQRKADELFSLVNKSKNAKEIGKEYVSILRNIQNNPEQRKTTDIDALIKDISINDLPIGFPGAPFLGIPKRPDDTSPKLNYYKPAPVNTYDLVQKNLAGIELDVPKKVGETDKDFYYKAVQKYKPEGIVTVAERVGKVVSGDPLLQSSYKVKGQQYSSEDMAKLNLLVKSLKDNSGKPLFPNLEVDIDDPVSIAIGEAVEDMIKREKSSNVFDKIAFAKYQSGLRKSEKEATTAAARPAIKGNAIDEIGEIKTVVLPNGGSIVDGIVRNAKGERTSGTAIISYEDLPANLISVLEFNKTPVSKGRDIVLTFKDGKILGLSQEGKPIKNRQTIENAQLKYSTEPLKGPQPKFGLKPYLIDGTYYSEKELLDMGYELEDIAPYLKK